MRKTTAIAIAGSLLAASIAGCGWGGGGPARSGASGLELPETTRLESVIREAPAPAPGFVTPAPMVTTITEAAPPEPSAVDNGQTAAAAQPAPAVTPQTRPSPAPRPAAAAPAVDNGRRTSPAAPTERKPAAKKKERPEKKSVPVQQHRVAQKAMSLAQLRHKYANNFKVSGSSAENKIALTFDDGPDHKFTAQVLDVLKQNNVKATFFVVGFRAKAHPELIARMAREGHVVGNHSYNHANLPKLSGPSFEEQIEATQAVLKSLLGYEPKLFRPPYGAVSEEQVRWAADHQFLIVNWNVDSLDWKGLSADKVSSNILTTTKAGSIILQHCGGGDGQDLSGTVKALPTVIRQLKSRGYQFVTVPELLHVPRNK